MCQGTHLINAATRSGYSATLSSSPPSTPLPLTEADPDGIFKSFLVIVAGLEDVLIETRGLEEDDGRGSTSMGVTGNGWLASVWVVSGCGMMAGGSGLGPEAVELSALGRDEEGAESMLRP